MFALGKIRKFSIGHLFRQSRTCHQKFQTKRGFLMKLIILFYLNLRRMDWNRQRKQVLTNSFEEFIMILLGCRLTLMKSENTLKIPHSNYIRKSLISYWTLLDMEKNGVATGLILPATVTLMEGMRIMRIHTHGGIEIMS